MTSVNFHRAGSGRKRPGESFARKRYSGAGHMGQANFVRRLGGRLHFCLHGCISICSGKNRCAKCERQRHARASERPTTHPAGSRCSCHGPIVRLFPPADKDKNASSWAIPPKESARVGRDPAVAWLLRCELHLRRPASDRRPPLISISIDLPGDGPR